MLKHRIILGGSCYAVRLVNLFNTCRDKFGWASAVELEAGGIIHQSTLIQDFFAVDGENIVLMDPRIIQDLVDPNKHVTFLKPWREPFVLSKNAPETGDKYIYCFLMPVGDAFLIFPYRSIKFLNRFSMNEPPPILKLSARALEEVVLTRYAHIFQFLRHVERLNIPMVLVEAPHRLREKSLPDSEYTATKALDKTTLFKRVRDILLKELAKINLPFLSLPAMLHDDIGYTKEEYRLMYDDSLHMNSDYQCFLLDFIMKGVLNLQNRRQTITSTGEIQAEAFPSPHPATLHYDASTHEVLKLTQSWEKTYTELRKIILQLEERTGNEDENLKQKYENLKQRYDQIKASFSWRLTVPLRTLRRLCVKTSKK